MKQIAAICACPPHFNPGMHLADLALDASVRRLGGAQAWRYALYLPSELRALGAGDAKLPDGLPLHYALLRDNLESALAADAVVYWGDFLHSRHYRQAVARLLVMIGAASGTEDALNIFDAHLFLRSAPAGVLRRVVSFGECLLMDDGSGLHDPHYDESARRFFGGIRGAWMRDAVSAAYVSEIRGDAESHLGADASLLLTPDDLAALCGGAVPRGEFAGVTGVFFARTKISPELSIGLAGRLAATLGLRAAWLPWFAEGAADAAAVRTVAPEIANDRTPQTLAQLLANLRACRLVVTDAYHLCLAAWNLGVPAVCVSRAAERFETAVSDKKKERFCATVGAETFLTYAEELEADASAAATRVLRALDDGKLARSIQARIASHRERSERALHVRLKEIWSA